jgi:predicted XRE-type DNA-binding protein
MKKNRMKTQSLKEVAAEWGIDYQTFMIKSDLIDKIKDYCREHSISQRNLAKMVPGLTQDRVSKIFSGQVGHMTIDKLITIFSALKIKVSFYARAA